MSLDELFFTSLKKGQKKTNVYLKEYIEFYIMGMLKRFSLTKELFKFEQDQKTKNLAFLLKKAIDEQNDNVKATIYQHIGDSSFFYLGIFKDQAKIRYMGEQYYIKHGRSAYFLASSLTNKTNKEIKWVFYDLSTNFVDYLRVLKYMGREWHIHKKDYLILGDKKVSRQQYSRFLKELKKHKGEG